MKGSDDLFKKKLNSVRDLLSDGFKESHIFLMSLGDTTKIHLKKNKLKTLKKAIINKDYYIIKSMLIAKLKLQKLR